MVRGDAAEETALDSASRQIARRPACRHRSRSSRAQRAAADAATRALPDRHLCDLLRCSFCRSRAAPSRTPSAGSRSSSRRASSSTALGLAFLLPPRVLDRPGPGPAVVIPAYGRPDAHVAPRHALVGNVDLLGYFKYYDLFVTSTNDLFALGGVDLPVEARSIILPVGISFFMFMAISYVVEIFRRAPSPSGSGCSRRTSPSSAPGRRPIAWPSEPLPQFQSPRDPRYVDTSRASSHRHRAVHEGGDRVSPCCEHRRPGLRRPNEHSSLEALFGIYAYGVQIYSDFFGDTNIAIRIALLLARPSPRTSRRRTRRRRHRLLPALAHDAVALAPRLPLHPTRRKSWRLPAHVPEPHVDDAHRRPVARGRRTFVVWQDPRNRACRRALVARTDPGSWSDPGRAAVAPGTGSRPSRWSASRGSSSAPIRRRRLGSHRAPVHRLG